MSRGGKIAAWIIVGIVVLIVLPGLAIVEPLFLMPARLLLGWASYLTDVLPRVSVSGEGVLLLAICLALAAAVGHGFCRWLWKGTGHETPWRPRWTFAGLGTIVLMFAAGMAVTGVVHQTGWLFRSPESLFWSDSNQRNAASSLKSIASAQADFRGNDRDLNGVNDYWRADIAGLYAFTPQGSPEPIKLIELSVALADDRPTTEIGKFGARARRGGYWFRALKFKDETTPDPTRYAACSYPSSPGAGKYVFIISNENTIYRKLFTGSPPETYPDDPIKEGWSKLD